MSRGTLFTWLNANAQMSMSSFAIYLDPLQRPANPESETGAQQGQHTHHETAEEGDLSTRDPTIGAESLFVWNST